MRIKGVVLEHHRHVAGLGRDIVDPRTIEQKIARSDRFQPGKHSQGRRFAAARRPKHTKELPVLDGEVEINDGAGAIRIGLVDIAEFDSRHCFT